MRLALETRLPNTDLIDNALRATLQSQRKVKKLENTLDNARADVAQPREDVVVTRDTTDTPTITRAAATEPRPLQHF